MKLLNLMGILYFIQPAELVGTNRFKVGCSAKNDLSRVKSYKVGTRTIMILQCEDPFGIEQKVLQEFNTRFHKIAGNEYFEGNELDMRTVFYETYLQWEQHDAIIDQLKKLISNVKESERKILKMLHDPNQAPSSCPVMYLDAATMDRCKECIVQTIHYTNVETDFIYTCDLLYRLKQYCFLWGNKISGRLLLQTIMENSNVYEKNGKVYGIRLQEEI